MVWAELGLTVPVGWSGCMGGTVSFVTGNKGFWDVFMGSLSFFSSKWHDILVNYNKKCQGRKAKREVWWNIWIRKPQHCLGTVLCLSMCVYAYICTIVVTCGMSLHHLWYYFMCTPSFILFQLPFFFLCCSSRFVSKVLETTSHAYT